MADTLPNTSTAKGYDNSPPRNGVIAFYTVLAVAVLIGTDFLLDSYFAKMMDAEVHEKVLTRGLNLAYETRAREQAELEKSGIANAIRTLSQQGRTGAAAIAPESGAGKGAVQGWSQLKREVPAPAAPAAASPQGAAPAPDATPPAAPAPADAPPAAGAANSTKAVNVSPQPANPNAAEVKPQIGGRAPTTGNSPVAPGNRSGPAAGAPR
jgi:hypothetical protein